MIYLIDWVIDWLIENLILIKLTSLYFKNGLTLVSVFIIPRID